MVCHLQQGHRRPDVEHGLLLVLRVSREQDRRGTKIQPEPDRTFIRIALALRRPRRRHDGPNAYVPRARHWRYGVLRVDHMHRHALRSGRRVRPAHLGLLRFTSVVDVNAHAELREHSRGAAQMIGVLVRDPKHIDWRASKVCAQISDKACGADRTRRAPGSAGTVARVH